MNKKTLILAGLGLMVLGAYLYTKAKSVAKSAEDKAGDAVANKVGDVTESILNKVKSGGDATVTNAVNNTLPPRLAPLPAPIRTAKDSVVSPDLAPASIVQNPRFNETIVWEPIVSPTTIVPQKSTVTISDSFDSNNWQNMVN
jgi:hypothetical protein